MDKNELVGNTNTQTNSAPSNGTLPLGYGRGEREQLPSRRQSIGYRVVVGNTTVFLHTGLYSDGRLGEIFLNVHKSGSMVNAFMDAFAVSVSKALQYGVPLEEFVDSFAFRSFEPAGMVMGDDDIKLCRSILDWVFRRLAIDFLDRHDLVSGGMEVVE